MKRESSQTCSVASVAVRVYTESRNRKPACQGGSSGSLIHTRIFAQDEC